MILFSVVFSRSSLSYCVSKVMVRTTNSKDYFAAVASYPGVSTGLDDSQVFFYLLFFYTSTRRKIRLIESNAKCRYLKN